MMAQEGKRRNFSSAKQKLLNGPPPLVITDSSNKRVANGPGTLACLSVRFALEFNADSISRAVACTQVERHMRLCLAATTGFERLITLAGSEPLLAEAASQLMRDSLINPVRHLAEHSDLNCIDRGRRGELVAALIVMQARDAALQHERRWVSVCEFMEALLPPDAYECLQSSLPTFWREGENRPFSETFEDCAMWFNHVIKIEDGAVINTKLLWTFITRGAMILCSHNQDGIDIVLPVCATKGNLSRDSVTAILIQVKNAKRIGCSIDKTIFDRMDPLKLRLFDEGSQKPVIRMVFALAPRTPDIVFPEIREYTNTRSGGASKFTAFDIWCAGLRSFKSIGDDLTSYELLLNRSLQPHDAFEVEETNDSYLDPETKLERGRRRRRMAALAMKDINHRRIYVLEPDDVDGDR